MGRKGPLGSVFDLLSVRCLLVLSWRCWCGHWMGEWGVGAGLTASSLWPGKGWGEKEGQGPSARVVCGLACGIQRASTSGRQALHLAASGREEHLPLPVSKRERIIGGRFWGVYFVSLQTVCEFLIQNIGIHINWVASKCFPSGFSLLCLGGALMKSLRSHFIIVVCCCVIKSHPSECLTLKSLRFTYPFCYP